MPRLNLIIHICVILHASLRREYSEAANKRKYNTFPLLKLQPISDDDEEAGLSDYERMNESGSVDVDSDITPLLRTEHTTGNNKRSKLHLVLLSSVSTMRTGQF